MMEESIYNKTDFIISLNSAAIAYVMYARYADYNEKVNVDILRNVDGRLVYAIKKDDLNSYYYNQYKEENAYVKIKTYNNCYKVLKNLNKNARRGCFVDEIDLDELNAVNEEDDKIIDGLDKLKEDIIAKEDDIIANIQKVLYMQ